MQSACRVLASITVLSQATPELQSNLLDQQRCAIAGAMTIPTLGIADATIITITNATPLTSRSLAYLWPVARIRTTQVTAINGVEREASTPGETGLQILLLRSRW